MTYSIAKTTIDSRSNNKVSQRYQQGKFSLIKKSGNLDQGLSDLVDLIIYWYKPQPAIDPDSGARQFIHKFQGNVWQTSYAYLSKKLNANKSTIRRRMIKLEELGYVKREFKDISVNGQGYNNRLFLHLSNDFFKTITGFNKASYNGCDKMFIDEQSFIALPQEYTKERMAADEETNEQIPIHNNQLPYGQKKVILNIDIYNTIFKNRSSKSNLRKNRVKAKPVMTEIQQTTKQHKSKDEKKETKQSPTDDNNDYSKNHNNDDNHDDNASGAGRGNDIFSEQEQLKQSSNNQLARKTWSLCSSVKAIAGKIATKIRGNKRKSLSEFYPLSEEDAELLRKGSGREFNLNFINQLLLKLSETKPQHGFFTKDLFMKYMSKVLTYELHQAPMANNEGFKFRAKDTEETKQIKHQEQYLEEVEYNTDTSLRGQLRRKIAAVFDANLAYKILLNYRFDSSHESKSYDSSGDDVSTNINKIAKNSNKQDGHSSTEFKLTAINNHSKVELSTSEQNKLLEQVQAVYGNNIERLSIKGLDPTTNTKTDSSTVKFEVLLGDPNSVWHKVSSALLKQCGEAVHISWFSKLVAEEDKKNRKLILKGPTNFISSWINEKYGYLINSLVSQYEYSCEMYRH